MSEVMEKVEHGIHEIKKDPMKFKKYEPDNGWGSVTSALECLKSIHEYFNPENLWQLPFDEDIPMECIYMCW